MIIDWHAHYVNPLLIDAVMDKEFGEVVQYDQALRAFQFPTQMTHRMPVQITELNDRLNRMDALGIDKQALSTWMELLGPDLPKQSAVRYHQTVNKGLAAAVKQYPHRFGFLASLPLPYGAEAAKMLEYAVSELGAWGAMIGTNVGGQLLDTSDFSGLWESAVHLNVPIFLHPVNVVGMERLTRYHLANLIGNPVDTTIAATSLIFGGVLDCFPTLRIGLVHGGGYFPYAVGRLEHGQMVSSEARGAQLRVSAYLRRFFYDVLVYRTEHLRNLAEMVGTDRIVLGTDYPFDVEPVNAVALTQQTFDAIGSTKILHTNSETLLRFPENGQTP